MRHLAVAIAEQRSQFENVHGTLDRLLAHIGVAFGTASGYELRDLRPETYLAGALIPNMAAEVWLRGEFVGVMGVASPAVLQNFEIKIPVTVLELNVQRICEMCGLL